MNVPPGIATNGDWAAAVVVLAVEAGGCVVVSVAEEVEEVGEAAVVVVGEGVAVAVAVTVMVVVGTAAVVEVLPLVVVTGFLHDGASPMEANVMPPITTPAFSKNSLRLSTYR